MFESLVQPVCPSIQDWQEAGASLVAALDKYLGLCCSLRARSLKEGTPLKDLAAQINLSLKMLQPTLDQQVALARSTLSQTRNQIMSPICCFPEEVLLEIFSRVIYTPPNPSKPTPMQEGLVNMHRSLHSLLGVCTTWRNAALHHKPFWSTIPIIGPNPPPLAWKFTQSLELGLERSGNLDLHLAAILSDQWHGHISNLADHASRFRTINVTAKTRSAIRVFVGPFLRLGPARKLSDLSIQLQDEEETSNTIPQFYDYLSRPADPNRDHVHFNEMLNGLSVLRISGALIHFDKLAFSSKLVKLQIQEVTLGHDAEIAKLMNALSSANQLRDLSIISVISFPDQADAPIQNISLPNLEHLLIRDLYNNTIHQILDSISTSSHHLTLHLTRICVLAQHAREPEPEDIGAEDVCELLTRVSVHTLLIDGEDENEWLDWTDIEEMMRIMPDLKSLQFYFWDLDENVCEALTRPKLRSNHQKLSLPALENIHISWSRIWDEECFKNMVESYSGSLRRMVLGASIENHSEGDFDSLAGDEDLVTWLEANVPEFELVDNLYTPPEFLSPEWELW
ncbi:unnamed protein product [Rhizoctonia solani]|uniref:F-box domain-containing protein n=1 Tax=Rhizoctonia solani TaxID=456999 RepID=A0A8H3HQL1_9AGAM|nr:unnamed protein product [Rhizoctonia solani]